MQWLSGVLQVVWPPSNRMWVTHQWFSATQSLQISSPNQQDVSDTWSDFLPPDLILWVKGVSGITGNFFQAISSYNQQEVSNTVVIIWWTLSFHFFLWSIVCEWPYNGLCEVVSSHFFLWPTACEWDWNDFLLCSYLTLCPMTNREWVTLQWLSAKQSIILHFMTNRWWVMLQSLFAWQSHHTCMSNRK